MPNSNKYILHCDMDNYYASVECIDNPRLRSCPLVVCGDPKMRHGIVLAKNQIAKKFGILTGETLYEAKKKCPNLIHINANYPKYLRYGKLARSIYRNITDKIYPYGLDEAWLDISDICDSFSRAKEIADSLRAVIKSELKLTVSIGVSFNFIFSKLASDMNKPDGTTVIPYNNYGEITKNIPAFDLLFVGPKARNILRKMRILTIGDLRDANIERIKLSLGKRGVMLHQFANGDDSSFDPVAINDTAFKSVGNTITPKFDICSKDDIKPFLYLLSLAVSKRLNLHNKKSNCIVLNIRRNDFTLFSKRYSFSVATNKADEIFSLTYTLFEKHFQMNIPVRSVGIRAERLCDIESEQISIFDFTGEDFGGVNVDMEKLIDGIKLKYGNINVEHNPFDLVGG